MSHANTTIPFPMPRVDVLDESETFEHMFDLAPVSLWLADYSDIKDLFGRWRLAGIVDLRASLLEEPARVSQCTKRIRVVKVNHRTLSLFGASNADHLVANLSRVFRRDMFEQRVDELVGLWSGDRHFSSAAISYSLSGRPIDIVLHATVLPGHEKTWQRVLLTIEDVTQKAQSQYGVESSVCA